MLNFQMQPKEQWRNVPNQGSKYTALVMPRVHPAPIADVTKWLPLLPAEPSFSLEILNTEAAPSLS